MIPKRAKASTITKVAAIPVRCFRVIEWSYGAPCELSNEARPHNTFSALSRPAMMFKTILSRRRRRRFTVISARTLRHTVFLGGGVIVGAAAAALAVAADHAQSYFAILVSQWRYASLLVTPAGFMLSVFLATRYFRNSQGSGIPQVIAARHFKSTLARTTLVSPRIAIGKVLLTLLGLLCGGSVGREGPTVQVGASIMFAIGRLSPRRQSGLLLAGSAAGVAAAFNTPLAGIIFGIEELSRTFESRTTGLAIVAVVTAGLTALSILGNYTYFGSSADTLHTFRDWLAVPCCGIAGGLFGGLFSQIVILFARSSQGLWNTVKRHRIALAGVCGVIVAAAGIVSGDLTYGTGYDQVKAAFEHNTQLTDSYGILKFVATLFSTLSGIPGGIFAPSLAVGAGLGSNLAHLFPSTPIGALIVLGMAGYFTGVVQAPMTAFVIVGEMTDNHAMMIPLMATALFAYFTSRIICSEGLYHALAKGFIQQGLAEAEPGEEADDSRVASRDQPRGE